MKKNQLKLIKQLDWKLILITISIFGFGILILTTATHENSTGNYKEIKKQLIAFVLGVILIISILRINYSQMGKNYRYFYLASIVLLLMVWVPGLGKEAKDFYGTLIITGVTSMFTYQIIQNIGMTMALIPVTGVTLPFISYGASSLVSSMAAVGLVLNVGMRKKK